MNRQGQEEPIFTEKGLEFYEQKSWADIVGQLGSAEKFRLDYINIASLLAESRCVPAIRDFTIDHARYDCNFEKICRRRLKTPLIWSV